MSKKNTEQKVQINRILMIDEEIRGGRYPSASKLARIAEVSVRTIWRDIDYLRLMYNAPLEYSREKRGYYYTEQNFFIKSILLTEGDLFSLSLFDTLLIQYRNTPLEKNLKEIFQKIVSSLPNKITVAPDFLSPRVSFIPGQKPAIQNDVFKTVFSGLQKSKTLIFEYHTVSHEKSVLFTVDPYHAVCHSGAWYLIGYCHYNREPLVFTFSRIGAIKITGNSFTIPSTFNHEDYFDKEIGILSSDRIPYTIELAYNKNIRSLAFEHYWNKTQKITQNDDKTVGVTFTTTQIHEVLWRILSFGSLIKIINPPELIALMQSEITKMQKLYQ
jgi:predicted DNA-binding transcriptional regulator YafY